MSGRLSRKQIVKKTLQVSALKGVSRLLGILRGTLLIRFLGLSALSDAFIVAYRVPDLLRKIFSEGAIAHALVPTFVELSGKRKRAEAESLLSWAFLFFVGTFFLGMLFVWAYPGVVLSIAPGLSIAQRLYAIPIVRILFVFSLFISGSAVLAGALQTLHKFTVAPLAQILNSAIFLVGIIVCILGNYSARTLSYWVVAGGMFHFAVHAYAVFANGFHFGPLTRKSFRRLKGLLAQCGATLAGVSALEFNFMIDALQAAAFATGTVGMVHYAGRFVGIPLGMFGVAFSAVLLPRFARTRLVSPSRLPYYLFEAAKLCVWVLLPATAALLFFAPHMFSAFLPATAGPAQIAQASSVLRVYAFGLLFFSINRVILNLQYAVGDRISPTVGAVLATLLNVLGNRIALLSSSPIGIALSTVVSQIFLTVFCLAMLWARHDILFYWRRFLFFLPRCVFHVCSAVLGYAAIHAFIFSLLHAVLPLGYAQEFFLHSYGYWIIVAPLLFGAFRLFHKTRKLFGVRLYFVG